MPGLNASLNIGLSGLMANQGALSVVGHNIANVNTPGYTRQTVQLASTMPQTFDALSYGTGVRVTNIMGQRNTYLNLQITQSTARQAGAEVKYEDLQGIDTAFAEDGTNGLGSQLQAFFTGLQDVASHPEDLSQRTAFLGKAQTLVSGFKARYQALLDQRKIEDQSITDTMAKVNDLTSQIASLNQRIASNGDSNGVSDARDQRQQLTDELAGIIGIQVSEDNSGNYQISLDNGSAVLVTGSKAYTMSAEVDPSNDYQHKVMLKLGDTAAPVEVTQFIKEGKLGGQLELRDKTIPGFMNQLDQLAAGLAKGINQVHAAGYGLKGTTGVDLFLGSTGNTGGLPNGITAASGYKGMVSALCLNTAVVKDPSLLAASGAADTPGDNSVANAMLKLQTAANTVDTDGDGVGDSGPFSSTVSRIVSSVGTAVDNASSRATTQQNLLTALQNQRDSISAVSLDEEATNLLTYQRGYQASARFVNVISQLTDQLIQSMGT